MTAESKHISVCICTFKRPRLLKRLLDALDSQDTEGLFTYSAVVADNDCKQSARQVVAEHAAVSSINTVYCVEPEQNIAMARNKSLVSAKGDFIAFIDDDEYPANGWLCTLFKTCSAYDVDGVLGPVIPYFEHEPPAWIVKGKFFDRPTYETGYKMDWSETRTGNVLFRRQIVDGVDEAFRPAFGTGSEDVDFFGRMMGKGHVFVWCNEAPVYELVPPSRCSIKYFLKRALVRGRSFPKRQRDRISNIAKSIIAVPVYALSLPFLAVLGKHIFVRYLVKLVDHASRIFAFLGVVRAGERAS